VGTAYPMAVAKRAHSLWLALVGGIVVGLFVGTFGGCDRRDESAGLETKPSTRPVPVAREFADYAGSGTCRECHAKQFEPWAHSHHGLAERALDPKRDDVAFEPPRMVEHGSQTSGLRKDGEAFVVETLGADGRVSPHVARRVIGEKPLWQFIVDAAGAAEGTSGGGSALAEPVAPHDNFEPVAPREETNQKSHDGLSSGPIGRQQVLELCYDPAKHEWFNVYGDEDRKPGEWGHWTGRGMNWNSQCASCHNTRLKKNYDVATDTYATTMAEPTVSCEACHGPMKAHVDWQRDNVRDEARNSPNPESRPPNPAPDPTLRKFTSTEWLAICGSCHARRGELTGDFVPGDSFFDHYSLVVPDLSEIFYADGQVREEDYEFTSFMSSRMYTSGVTCLHCHDPHKARPLDQGNALCMKCHNGSFPKSVRIDPATHTFHAADSTGSQCVNCHMPQTVYMQRHSRHDHGFTTPDPFLTKQLGIPNACNRCHTDKDADWSLAAVEKWYGDKMNRPSRRRAQVIAAARAGNAAAAREGLLTLLADKDNAFWQASAATVMRQGALLEQDDVQRALLGATAHSFPLVREKAAGALEPLVDVRHRGATAALVKLLDDPVRSVRIAAAWELRATVDERSSAGKDVMAYMHHNHDQPGGAMQRGMWQLARQDVPGAISWFERAVQWDPNSAPIRDALAVGYSMQARPADAVREMQQAVRIAPRDAEYWYKLGLAWAELGETGHTIASLEKAVAADANHARAWHNLGLALEQRGKVLDGVNALRKAEAIDPRRADTPFALATIYAKHGRLSEAREAAARALRIDPNHAEARSLMLSLTPR
jgi:tetratricopeptide (TPR) repeat protein